MSTIVIDNGSGSIKAGFAGKKEPELNFSSWVGTPKMKASMLGESALNGDYFVGTTAVEHRGIMKINYPIEHGVVKSWDNMQRLWEYVFTEMNIKDSATNPVLLTEAPRNPLKNREKTSEIFFENFGSPSLFFQVAGILSLYASGRVTGTVLDCGDGVISAVPIYEGFALPSAIQRIDIGGRDITERLQTLLAKGGEYFYTSAEMETVRDIKEKICYVVENVKQAEQDAIDGEEPPIHYTLPDGTVVKIETQKFQAPEILFDPSIIGNEQPGVQGCLYRAIKKCDVDLRVSLFSNILLAGGCTMFQGFGNRLYAELKKITGNDRKIKIYAPRRRTMSNWVGGSILAQLATFKKMVVTRAEFSEHGANIIHKKCF